MLYQVVRLLSFTCVAFDTDSPHSPPLVAFDSLNYSYFTDRPGLHLRPLPYPGADKKNWVCGVSCCNQSDEYFSERAVVASSNYYDLLTPGMECAFSDTKYAMGQISEWGYEFQTFSINNPSFRNWPCVNVTMPSLALKGIKPATKLDALAMMDRYFQCRTSTAQSQYKGKVFNLIGHYYYSGMGAQLGATGVVASEIQENINSIQFHFALTRGTARQYAIPWAIDVSPWFAGFITDYSLSKFWGPASAAGGDGGHSLSLFKRCWYLSFLSGASQLIIEAGAVNLFLQTNMTSEGVMELSPLGQAARDFSSFTHQISDRGIPYTPVAIVLEHAHGFGLSLVQGGGPTTWDSFPLSESEKIAWGLLQSLYPGSWYIQTHGSGAESNYLVNSPYGDSIDILGERNFTDALSLYRVVMLAGEVSLSTVQLQELESWVTKGGTFIAFASQFSNASEAASLIGADIASSTPLNVPTLEGVMDTESGWVNRSLSPSSSSAFCAPQNNESDSGWYIKVGGDPTVTIGWGPEDKCCRVTSTSCRWFKSKTDCDTALAVGPLCLPCVVCSTVSIGCPNWKCEKNRLGYYSANRTTSTAVIEGSTATGDQIPLVLRNNVGKGVVLTYLLENNDILQQYGIQEHVLERVTGDVLPFVLTSVGQVSNDMLQELEIITSRIEMGWRVTIVNNNGVTKQPDQAAIVDESQIRTTFLQLKDKYGVVKSATSQISNMTDLPVVNNGVQIQIPAGDLVVIDFALQ